MLSTSGRLNGLGYLGGMFNKWAVLSPGEVPSRQRGDGGYREDWEGEASKRPTLYQIVSLRRIPRSGG